MLVFLMTFLAILPSILRSRASMELENLALRQVVGEELQCDVAVQPRIFGLADHTHSAPAQLLDDAIVGNGLPDKRVGVRHSAIIVDRPYRRAPGASEPSTSHLAATPPVTGHDWQVDFSKAPMQLRVLRFRVPQDRNIWVSVFAECEEILIRRFRLPGVALHGIGTAELKAGERADRRFTTTPPTENIIAVD
jgi:hypothetical protein